MYEPRPADIALPPTVSIDLNHLFPVSAEAGMPASDNVSGDRRDWGRGESRTG